MCWIHPAACPLCTGGKVRGQALGVGEYFLGALPGSPSQEPTSWEWHSSCEGLPSDSLELAPEALHVVPCLPGDCGSHGLRC